MNLIDNARLDQECRISIKDPATKPVLDALVSTIHEAHRINPSSWALLLTQGGWIVVTVANSAIMSLQPRQKGDFLLEGSVGEFSSSNDSFPGTVTEWRHDISKATFSDYESWLEALNQYHERHFEAVRQLVSEVNTNTARWPEHARPLVLELRAAGYDIPDPQYIPSGWNRPDWVMVPSPTGYWRIGLSSEDELRENAETGVVSIPDPAKIGDLRAVTTEGQDPDATLAQQLGASTAEELLWLFRDVQIGDQIIANHGTTLTMSGVITGDYEFQNAMHARAVDWNTPISITGFGGAADQVIKRPRSRGLTPIKKSFFQDLVSAIGAAKQPSEEIVSSPSTFLSSTHIAQHFLSRGLSYTSTQIAEFYTALQTKGFVVLSGISGTGKSKIAQHFTEMLPDGIRLSPTDISSPDDTLIAWSALKPYNIRHSRVVIPAKDEILFPPLQLRQSEPVTLRLDDQSFRGRIYQGNTLQLFWRKDFTNVISDIPLDTAVGYKPVYLNDRQDVRDLDFIEVILGTQSSVEPIATEPVNNTLFLSVRPDWRDGTSLLGYYNPLTQTYEWTDFLRFVLNAVDNLNSDRPVAWFVILDEMNLAHVEYYFADLLSVLESGRDTRGFTTEPIRLTYPDTVVNDTPPTEIHLPPNLYILGTVNMDETTHAFSPKVLDRAFTMELSDVDFLGYEPGIVADAPELPATARDAMLAAFTVNGWPAIDKSRIGEYIARHPEIRKALHNLNAQLARNRFHFGYRVFDEIVQFLANAETNAMFASVEDAFDSAVFMKILPKFSGSEGRVGAPLRTLHDWSRAPFGEGNAPLTRTLDRVGFMLRRLEEDGFVTAF